MQNTQKGFTLFIAVLIGSLMLAIGFSIFNLTFKELLLTASARESQVAFYAADTGLECALYYDQRENKFDPSSVSRPTVSCILPGTQVIPSGSSTNKTWRWSFEVSPDVCVKVEVNKVSGIGATSRTTIKSYGYNTCDSGDTKRTERGLQVTYRGI